MVRNCWLLLFGFIAALTANGYSASDPNIVSPSCYKLVGEWGSEGSGASEFGVIEALAVAPDGKVYVLDGYPNYRVQYFTPTGTYLGAWGSEIVVDENTATGIVSARSFKAIDAPFDISAAPDGSVYLVTSDILRVKHFDASGSYLGGWETSTHGNGEWISIAVAPNGNVFILDANKDVIRYFSPSGEALGCWTPGEGYSPENYTPWDIAVAPTGDVYVVDVSDNKVQHFTDYGSLLNEWGSHGTGPGQFVAPTVVAVGPNGKVFVGDSFTVDNRYWRFQLFSPAGDFLAEFKSRDYTDSVNILGGLAVAPDGTVYVADSGNHRIQYFRPVPANDN